uniref:Putative secreted protein n=1 Tax=Amblyomma triste TaxID=251400 RepID=A0A023G2A1_AMBTT
MERKCPCMWVAVIVVAVLIHLCHCFENSRQSSLEFGVMHCGWWCYETSGTCTYFPLGLTANVAASLNVPCWPRRFLLVCCDLHAVRKSKCCCSHVIQWKRLSSHAPSMVAVQEVSLQPTSGWSIAVFPVTCMLIFTSTQHS